MLPREFFPKMPDEVFDMWLGPFIQELGWPFGSPGDNLQATDWRYRLGLDHSLQQWYSAEWELIGKELSDSLWTTGSRSMMAAIVRNVVHGENTETANVMDTEKRFWACTRFIREHGTLPKPIVVKMRGGGFEIMDGNHRMAAVAFLHSELPSDFVIPVWLAKLKSPPLH